MIKSKLIASVLLKFSEYNQELSVLPEQIKYLTENEFEYTGSGLFVDFIIDETAYKYPIYSNIIFSGAYVYSPKVICGAETLLKFEKGVISSLEMLIILGKN
jgi:hypothetical protein